MKVKAGYLSGGEYKILTLTIAYSSGAELLLIDEPSSGLFPKVKQEVIEILKNLGRRGVTMLVAEQDYEMAISLSDRIYEIEAGLIRPSSIL